ncbi:MAG TPA: sulfatase-like hydrolase/transferase [Isosphaeraceae bacterium]|jgi:arylsulfatase A-like enzyme|nr:sulfatase-like hydrolase/transferase [Isosphaeraceae bacterium]
MPYRILIAAALVTLLGPCSTLSQAHAAEKPPNILLIYADDLGWGDVGFNGRKEWATPNLDKLGARGTIFKRFYAAAVVCAPSRAALMTGKCTIHNGVSRNNDDLPSREVTIAEALRDHGYATALFGKWHHGIAVEGEPLARRYAGERAPYVHPLDQGFEEFFGFTDAVHAWEKFPKTLWEGRERKPSSGYADDLFADRTIDYLRRHQKSERPVFIYLAPISAHFNIEAPEDEIALHKGNFPEANPEHPLRATYAAQVTRLDKQVGRVLATLDELGLAENTLIVFTSDHGATFEKGNLGVSNFHDSNRPFRGQKRTLWEGGVRVPAIACWPGHIPDGSVSNDVIHMTDVLPTLLAAAGAQPEPAWHVDGLNQWPAWTGKSTAPADRTLFWEWRSEGSDQIAAMRAAFKLVITSGGRPELFDVVADPAERRNISAEHPDVVEQLQNGLKAWLATELHH